MRDRALLAVLLMFLSVGAQAQSTLQPTPAPLVTAEKTSWYRSGEPIVWNSQLYYPAGVFQYFNGDHMVRSGFYRGIPLYVDSALEPNSIVFVPLAGGRMQPYERPRTGELAGTTGSRMSNLPPAVGEENTPVPVAVAIGDDSPRVVLEPMPVGTSGRIVATSTAIRPVMSTLKRPTGANGIWVSFDGRRWFNAGKAIDYDAASLTQVGTYRGWSVYQRNGDKSTIYIPVAPGKLSPYRVR